MLKKIALVTNMLAYLLAAPAATASNSCKEINGIDPGRIELLTQAYCINYASELAKSGQFPDIFTNPTDPELAYICYATDPEQRLQLTYAGVPVEAESISAWEKIDSESPFIKVITRVSLFVPGKNREFATFYTRETLLLTPNGAFEQAIVVGGNRRLDGAKGSLKFFSPVVENVPTVPIAPGFEIPEFVDLGTINGKICNSTDDEKRHDK